MVRIVKTEFYKLKRYHILWAGVALMLLSVLLTLFTSMANDGSVWDFAYLTEQVIKNNIPKNAEKPVDRRRKENKSQ